MFNEMWNVKLCLNLWETNKVHVRFHSVHLGNWPFFISCNYLGNKTQCKNHNVGVFVHVFSLSVSFFFKFFFFFFSFKIYTCLFLFLIFIILEFPAHKRCQSNSLKAIFQVELGGERLHHSPRLGSGASSINITKNLLRRCINLSCRSALCSGHNSLLQARQISA